MLKNLKKFKLLGLILPLVFTLIGCQSKAIAPKSDALWTIVSQQCVPNQKKGQNPSPCEEVSFVKDSEQGYVILKDKRGVLQYLLMPTTQITGVESPEILVSNTPNYFYEAWKSRSYMLKKHGGPIADDDISLAINSQSGRSQNQLHIHISCVREDVKSLVQKNAGHLSSEWKPFPGGLLGHAYWARTLTEKELIEKNIFMLVAQGLSAAKENMKDFGIGLIKSQNKWVVLVDQVNRVAFDRASVEEIQNHDCPQLKSN
jgi:CDP-diacylglycerol pyrophosphatase